jgi:hypothetical protein
VFSGTRSYATELTRNHGSNRQEGGLGSVALYDVTVPHRKKVSGETMSKQIIITMTESGRDSLMRTAQAVPDDKLNWKPLDNGRTVLDLLGDAAQTPTMLTRMLQSQGEFRPSREHFQQMAQERIAWSRDECVEKLRANTEAAIEAIRAVPDERLEEPLHLPMGGGMTLPLGVWMLMIYRTFAARTAQINYIQTLYGDFESH